MIQKSILQNIICWTHSAYSELECGIPAILTFAGTDCILKPPMQVLTSPSCSSPAMDWHSSGILELDDFTTLMAVRCLQHSQTFNPTAPFYFGKQRTDATSRYNYQSMKERFAS